MSVTIPHDKLVVYNDYGSLTIFSPFQPFGPGVNQYSNLIVGSSVLLGKTISTLTISLTWYNLPADFSEYYAAYNRLNYDFDNQSFRISASILHKGNWVKLNVLPDVRLFKSDANGILNKISSFILQPENDVITIPDIKFDETFKYTDKSSEGFLKIQLIAPQYGFGGSIYSGVVADIAFKNASGHNLPTANLPYSPTAQSISVSYG